MLIQSSQDFHCISLELAARKNMCVLSWLAKVLVNGSIVGMSSRCA